MSIGVEAGRAAFLIVGPRPLPPHGAVNQVSGLSGETENMALVPGHGPPVRQSRPSQFSPGESVFLAVLAVSGEFAPFVRQPKERGPRSLKSLAHQVGFEPTTFWLTTIAYIRSDLAR